MNNVYREAFVFECALRNRKFYLPQHGEMQLQFFHIDDLFRFMDVVLEKRPAQHIFNVGNSKTVSILDWVSLCYQATGKKAEFVNISDDVEQRNYFCFYPYEYRLDVTSQQALMPETKPLESGLRESFEWYASHSGEVNRKPLIQYIDDYLA